MRGMVLLVCSQSSGCVWKFWSWGWKAQMLLLKSTRLPGSDKPPLSPWPYLCHFMTFCSTLHAYQDIASYCLCCALESLRPLHILLLTLQPSLGSLYHLQLSITATLADEPQTNDHLLQSFVLQLLNPTCKHCNKLCQTFYSTLW